jgi:uncharacterized LabA/DUF88 family protein
MQRVNIYVDGFNFYYGLRSKKWKKYYWLDIVVFFEKFMKPNQELYNVFYCTAVQKDIQKKNRQDLFFSANKLNPKFKLIFGKFLKKEVSFGGNKYFTFEEKQTDVNIAVQLIRNVVLDKCDISIIVSADSDLVPPIEFIRELNPEHKIFCYFPPKRHSTDLTHKSDAVINLEKYEQRFKNSILPEKIELKNGYIVEIPEKWKKSK